MGNYRCRRPGYIPGWQINVAQMMFQGKNDDYIVGEIWPELVEKDKVNAGKQRLQRLRKDEKFLEYYKSLMTEWKVHNVGKAMTRLAAQIDDPNGWLANKAANDVLNQCKDLTGNDENTVVVKVEGMPELGVPDDE